MKKLCSTFALLLFCLTTYAADQFVTFRKADGAFQIIGSGKVVNILLDEKDQKGIGIAVNNLIEDFNRVCGMKPQLLKNTSSENCIIVGSLVLFIGSIGLLNMDSTIETLFDGTEAHGFL